MPSSASHGPWKTTGAFQTGPCSAPVANSGQQSEHILDGRKDRFHSGSSHWGKKPQIQNDPFLKRVYVDNHQSSYEIRKQAGDWSCGCLHNFKNCCTISRNELSGFTQAGGWHEMWTKDCPLRHLETGTYLSMSPTLMEPDATKRLKARRKPKVEVN